jgi:membrane-bound lytic murein transglycosylase D
LAEVPLEDFKSLNPSLNRPVIMASGTPQILLPWDNATLFMRNLDAYAGSTASWMVWVAPSTMKAADVAKRVGMPEAELRSINNIPNRMMVGAGSMLVVPRPAHVVNDVVATVADSGQVSLAPESVPRRPVPRKGKAAGGKSQAVAKTGTGNKSTVATNKNKASPNLVAKR